MISLLEYLTERDLKYSNCMDKCDECQVYHPLEQRRQEPQAYCELEIQEQLPYQHWKRISQQEFPINPIRPSRYLGPSSMQVISKQLYQPSLHNFSDQKIFGNVVDKSSLQHNYRSSDFLSQPTQFKGQIVRQSLNKNNGLAGRGLKTDFNQQNQKEEAMTQIPQNLWIKYQQKVNQNPNLAKRQTLQPQMYTARNSFVSVIPNKLQRHSQQLHVPLREKNFVIYDNHITNSLRPQNIQSRSPSFLRSLPREIPILPASLSPRISVNREQNDHFQTLQASPPVLQLSPRVSIMRKQNSSRNLMSGVEAKPQIFVVYPPSQHGRTSLLERNPGFSKDLSSQNRNSITNVLQQNQIISVNQNHRSFTTRINQQRTSIQPETILSINTNTKLPIDMDLILSPTTRNLYNSSSRQSNLPSKLNSEGRLKPIVCIQDEDSLTSDSTGKGISVKAATVLGSIRESLRIGRSPPISQVKKLCSSSDCEDGKQTPKAQKRESFLEDLSNLGKRENNCGC